MVFFTARIISVMLLSIAVFNLPYNYYTIWFYTLAQMFVGATCVWQVKIT